MEDVRPILQECREISILERRLEESEAGPGEKRGQIALLGSPRIVIGKAVNARDVSALLQETLGKRRSDESGNAGD